MTGGIKLMPFLAKIGDIMVFEEEGEIGYWKKDGYAKWEINIENSGEYDIYMNASCDENQGGEGILKTADKDYEFTVYPTGSFSDFYYICLKKVYLKKGRQDITILPSKMRQLFFMNLKEVLILPHGAQFCGEIIKSEKKRKRPSISDKVLEVYQNMDRKSLYRYRLDRMLEEYDRAGGKKVTWPGGFWQGLVILWNQLGEEKYLERILKKARQWIEIYKRTGKLPQYNFPSKISITELLEAAINSGDFSEEEKDTALCMIKSLMFKSVYEGGGVMNRNIGYCLGIAAAKEYIKDEPGYELLEKMLENLDSELSKTMEPLENSTNYEDITLMFMINYIEKRGLEYLWDKEGMKNTFYNLISKLTPECGLACYGDYGGKIKFSALFAAIYEAAARIYCDRRFSYAATCQIQNIEAFRVDAKDEAELDGWMFIGLANALRWCDEKVLPQKPNQESRIIYKNDGQLDKAVFFGGGLYMMMDFVCGCEHGCNNTLGIMSVQKDGKTALFDMGHRDEGNHSKVFARFNDKNFPKVIEEEGEWEEGSLKLSNYWSWGVFNNNKKRFFSSLKNGFNDFLLAGCDIDYEPEKEFLLAVLSWNKFSGKKKSGGEFCIRNMRLESRGGKQIKLDIKSGWTGNTEYNDGVLKVSATDGVIAAKVFDFPLDIMAEDAEYLKFDIKANGLLTKDLMFTIGDNTYYPHNYPMFLNPMGSAKELYFNRTDKGTVAGFELDMKDYSQIREIAFVNGAGIRIKDTVTVKADMPLTVGSAWRFDGLSQIDDRTFYTGGECPMYVSFLENAQVTEDGIYGHESENVYNRYIISCKKRVSDKGVFDTLLYFDKDVIFDESQTVLGGKEVVYTDKGFVIK